MVKYGIREHHESQERARVLAMMSLRLRLIALTLWSKLWIQRAFPQLNVVPGSVLGVYEEFAMEMRDYLGLRDRAAPQL